MTSQVLIVSEGSVTIREKSNFAFSYNEYSFTKKQYNDLQKKER